MDVKAEWMSRAGVCLLLGCVSAACGAERTEPPPVAATAAKVTASVTTTGGVMRMEAPLGDVATLQRQPDGTYKRVCGEPQPEVRTMLEGVIRARRAAK
jgi:hypothetical protein